MKKQFVEALEEEYKQEEEQKKLHKKHNIENEDVVVVEKSNMLKFSVNTVSSIIRTLSAILLIILATIGLISLVYPATRKQLIMIAQQVIEQLHNYL